MVQNSEPKRRGRPRAYDPAKALARAMAAFWDGGYAATSLDDLGEATGMNRPSLYGAFGDKQSIYLKALEQYRSDAREALSEELQPDIPLWEALSRLYARALSIYLSGRVSARGCFLIGTAATEAVGNPLIREVLWAGLHEIDEAVEARIVLAQAQGEIDADTDARLLAKLATGLMHTLAVRARAGEGVSSLKEIAAAAVRLICGRRGPRA